MNYCINLLHLKFFCDAVQYRSLAEAAKRNFVTQSAVSHAINKLEQIFDLHLVSYEKQKIFVTKEGEIVFEQARQIFGTLQESFVKIQELKEHVRGPINFITTKSLGMSFIPIMRKLMEQEFPNVQMKYRMGGLNTIRTALKKEEVDFAIVIYDYNFDQFERELITTGQFHLYKSKNISQKNMEQTVFVYDYEMLYTKELQQHLETLNKKYEVQAVAGIELAACFADQKLGLSFIPDYIVANNRYPNLEVHSLGLPPFEYEICAIYNKGSQLSHAAKTFIDRFTLD